MRWRSSTRWYARAFGASQSESPARQKQIAHPRRIAALTCENAPGRAVRRRRAERTAAFAPPLAQSRWASSSTPLGGDPKPPSPVGEPGPSEGDGRRGVRTFAQIHQDRGFEEPRSSGPARGRAAVLLQGQAPGPMSPLSPEGGNADGGSGSGSIVRHDRLTRPWPRDRKGVDF